MADDPHALLWNAPPPPPRQPKPGELLFQFIRASDHAPMSCELRFNGESYGWEAQFFERGELSTARRIRDTCSGSAVGRDDARLLRWPSLASDRRAMTYDDALGFLTDYLRDPSSTATSNYGYDIWLANVAFQYLYDHEGATDWSAAEDRMKAVSPHFFTAAWDVCRRGVLRPGVKHYQAQA